VGRVRPYYDPAVPHTNQKAGRHVRRDYETPIPVEKGQELGAFEMGSTVILLFQPGKVRLDPGVAAGARVRVGGRIGEPPPLPVTG
jgi:phosphatidylserine decarboxylase